MTTLIEARKLEKLYNPAGVSVKAIDGVDFRVVCGESVAVNGKSGSGKTTLLNMLGALEVPTHGEIFFRNEPYASVEGNGGARMRRKMGFVFQSHNLLNEFTVIENVAMPCLISGMRKKRACEKAAHFLNILELEGKLASFPDELSAGQRQRVAIARALITEPEIVFADEPTGNLDPKTSEAVARTMLSMKDETGVALIVATHSAEVSEMFDRKVVMSEGRVEHA